MGKGLKIAFGFFIFVFIVFTMISIGGVLGFLDLEMDQPKLKSESVLFLELEGPIIDSKIFTKNLYKYAKEEDIRGVLIRVNSPGGVVGPSQEIYSEIKRVREELQKPVVVSGTALVASGAYYAAAGADKFIVNPGTLVGSIGVIMSFANLEGLYDWAKIKRASITTGRYKDSGADYRPMREDERVLFQSMADEILNQFKAAVKEGRKLSLAVIDKYADGRVFTGQTAVDLGFADSVGTFRDAVRIVGELSGLGDEPKLFKPPKERPDIFEFLASTEAKLGVSPEKFLSLKLMGQPLYMMPGSLGL